MGLCHCGATHIGRLTLPFIQYKNFIRSYEATTSRQQQVRRCRSSGWRGDVVRIANFTQRFQPQKMP